MLERPYLLDATRLISRSWTQRSATGIDRVCYAYLDHFGSQSQAVVQHRGVFRVLTAMQSDILYEMLQAPADRFRRKIVGFAPQVIAGGASVVDANEAIYINVSHTDFDLPSHIGWTRSCGMRPVYLLHDLIPITHSEYCNAHAVARHTGRVTNALRTAAGIIVNSHATASDLEAYAQDNNLPLPPVLPAALAGADLRADAGKADHTTPYFVCVGTIEARKNHVMLIKLWSRLLRRMGANTPQLMIIGQWGANSDPVRELLAKSAELAEHVTIIEQCPDAELGGWIACAQALLMPTLAEGFGLPMVEALALGTPVIASDLPCFREIGQGIPALLAPADTDAWKRAILASVTGGAERKRQQGLMPSYRPSTWESHFAKVENWFDGLAGYSQHNSAGSERRRA